MNVWHRILTYALVTAVIEGFFIWRLFSYGSEFPPLWIYWIVMNVGLIIFNPLESGPPPTGFFALITGTVSMFLMIYVICETIIWLRKKRVKP